MPGSIAVPGRCKHTSSNAARRARGSVSIASPVASTAPRAVPRQLATAALAPALRRANVRARYAAVCTQPRTEVSIPEKLAQLGYRTDFADKFTIGNKLGSGSFGTVHEAIDRMSGRTYAVKSIPKRFKEGQLDDHFVHRIKHEVDIYTTLGRSHNVCTLHSVYESDESVDIVTELCAGGELRQRLLKQGKYSESEAAFIITRVLETVADCHAKGVVLRDVKPDNFLFLDDSEDAPLKMIDFGLSEWCKPDDLLTARAGTTWYVAPEVLRQCYGQKCDLWSAGILAYVVLLGQMPYRNEEGALLAPTLKDIDSDEIFGRDVFRGILTLELEREGSPLSELSDGAFDFLKMLLNKDPDTRPSALEALQHPWLQTAVSPAQHAIQEEALPAGVLLSAQEAQPGGGVLNAREAKLEGCMRKAQEAAQLLDGSVVQRLKRYATYGPLKKDALLKMAQVVSEHDFLVTKEKAAFQLLADGGETVPLRSMVNVLNSSMFKLSEDEAQRLSAELQLDEDKGISYYEFLAAMLDWEEVQQSSLWQSWVMLAFHQLDADQLGRLSSAALQEEMSKGTFPAAMHMAERSGQARHGEANTQPSESIEKMMGTHEAHAVFVAGVALAIQCCSISVQPSQLQAAFNAMHSIGNKVVAAVMDQTMVTAAAAVGVFALIFMASRSSTTSTSTTISTSRSLSSSMLPVVSMSPSGTTVTYTDKEGRKAVATVRELMMGEVLYSFA